ncbi:MAG: hypothetical protein ACKOE6_03285 [Flammeovirgaceae bacterium]
MQADFIKSIVADTVKDAVKTALNDLTSKQPIYIDQEFIPLAEAMKKYDFSASSARSYHRAGHLKLRRIDKTKRGKLYVSRIELESLLRNNIIGYGE